MRGEDAEASSTSIHNNQDTKQREYPQVFDIESLSSESDERRRRGSVFDFDPQQSGHEAKRIREAS
jgi:hypothetical protein